MASPLFSAPTLTFKDSLAVKVALRDAEVAMEPKPPDAAGGLSAGRLQAPSAAAPRAVSEIPMLAQSPPRAAHAQAAVDGEYQSAERQDKQQLPQSPSKVLVNTGGQQPLAANKTVGFHRANGKALAASFTNPVGHKAGAKEDVGGFLIDMGIVLAGGLVFGLLIWLIMRRMAQQRESGDAPSKGDYLPIVAHPTQSGDAPEPARAEEKAAGGVGAKDVEVLKVRGRHG